MTPEISEILLQGLSKQRDMYVRHSEMAMDQYRATKRPEALDHYHKAIAALQDINRQIQPIKAQRYEAILNKEKLCGDLQQWSLQMQDANRNPRTPPAERHFNLKAIERITTILGIEKTV